MQNENNKHCFVYLRLPHMNNISTQFKKSATTPKGYLSVQLRLVLTSLKNFQTPKNTSPPLQRSQRVYVPLRHGKNQTGLRRSLFPPKLRKANEDTVAENFNLNRLIFRKKECFSQYNGNMFIECSLEAVEVQTSTH